MKEKPFKGFSDARRGVPNKELARFFVFPNREIRAIRA